MEIPGSEVAIQAMTWISISKWRADLQLWLAVLGNATRTGISVLAFVFNSAASQEFTVMRKSRVPT